MGGSPAGSGPPAPLPVRGSHGGRFNPAEALPGIRPDERARVAEHTATPSAPRTGTVRGTMGKPQLPRRRAQEHIAPQLRDGPAPRQDSEHVAGHDPGLMAAFQRGIGLAEAQQNMEPEHTGAAHTPQDPTTGSAHMEPQPGERPTRIELHPPLDPTRTESTPTPTFPASPLDARHTDAQLTDARHTDAHHMDAGATTMPHPVHHPVNGTPVNGTPVDVTPMDPAHIAEARPASARGVDHPTRHDGSAPAG
ncbi:hypothetical protein [Streptomyces plumbidurans]|uniref:hypothetical protein n=1 Tax=Streptomyces plumbidurans TaxID=2814589 RepID=UPI003557C037